MRLVRTIGWPVILSFFLVFVSHGAEFADTSFRTNNGDLLTKGMSKAEVIVRFRRPDEKDVITSALGCQTKIEVWNYNLKSRLLIVTFTGNQVSNIKLVDLR